MTTIKYRAGTNIAKVEVERESESSVWVARGMAGVPRREAKANTYFDTWGLAREYLLAGAYDQVEYARRQLELANARLGNIKGMKEPAP